MDDTAAAEPDPELMPVVEGTIASARELEALLVKREIPVVLSAKPTSSCCSGAGCGCGSKLQVLVYPADVPKVLQILDASWLDSVRREGVVGDEGLVSLRAPAANSDEGGRDPCPACGHAGARTEGACSDCGLQLE